MCKRQWKSLTSLYFVDVWPGAEGVLQMDHTVTYLFFLGHLGSKFDELFLERYWQQSNQLHKGGDRNWKIYVDYQTKIEKDRYQDICWYICFRCISEALRMFKTIQFLSILYNLPFILNSRILWLTYWLTAWQNYAWCHLLVLGPHYEVNKGRTQQTSVSRRHLWPEKFQKFPHGDEYRNTIF